jgi:hypothetical protein
MLDAGYWIDFIQNPVSSIGLWFYPASSIAPFEAIELELLKT